MRLEIGFGGGEHLIAEAERHPRIGFIGIEPFVNGMAKALAAIEERKLANIRLHHGDATDLLAWLPAAPRPLRPALSRSVAEAAALETALRAGRKRRAIARMVRPGGEFRFASDIPDYVAWTLARLLRSPDFAWTAERADDWRQPWPGFTARATRPRPSAKAACRAYLIFRR